jgi:hypothetical protein
MPKTGVPLDASPARTHTGTEQWQSFEIRMRHRRAERCLVRAEGALDAGLEAEARAALDEARSLKSETPSFEDLLAAARGRREAADAGRRQRTRRAAVVAAAGLIVMVGLGWAIFETRETAEVETAAAAPEPMPPPLAQATTGGQVPAVVETSPAPADAGKSAAAPDVTSDGERVIAAAPRPAAPPPIPRESAPQRRTADQPGSIAVKSAASPAMEVPVPEVPVPTTTETIPRPSVDASLTAGAVGAPATASMSVPAPPPSPAPKEAVSPPPADPASQEPAVRNVLARFEAAYSSLSASAARQVWPSVDARSLSRAFEGLESQRVSLGNCRVTVESSTARAECSGSATWTPKVGGGRRTEARRWEFDLARDNGAWLILQARAR